jgi:hypothetical protein
MTGGQFESRLKKEMEERLEEDTDSNERTAFNLRIITVGEKIAFTQACRRMHCHSMSRSMMRLIHFVIENEVWPDEEIMRLEAMVEERDDEIAELKAQLKAR